MKEKKEIEMRGPAVSYCDLLDHEIKEKLATPKKQAYPLRPSAAGYCSRRLAYDLMQYKGLATYPQEKMEPNVYRLLQLGHSVEYSALKNFELLKDFDLKYKQQSVSLFRLAPTPDDPQGKLVEGSTDVVLWSDKYKCVLDVKSQKDGFSAAYKTRWDETLSKYAKMSSLVQFGENAFYADDLSAFIEELGGDWLVDNLHQLNLYACSPFLKERGIDHAVIYKYGKNDSRHYEIRFKPCQKLFDAIQAKFNTINQAVANKEPEAVKKEFMLGSSRCAFCPYQKQCWSEDATKAWFRTFPPKDWPTRASEIPKDVKALVKKYEKTVIQSEEAQVLEKQILARLEQEKISKLELDDGAVYEVKFLKSPKPHFELRRGKK